MWRKLGFLWPFRKTEDTTSPPPATQSAPPTRVEKPSLVLPDAEAIIEKRTPSAAQVPAVVAVGRVLPIQSILTQDLTLMQRIGDGGEAVVYVTPNMWAWKVFRTPNDDAYRGDEPDCVANRLAARKRLEEYPNKFQEYPLWLGSRVVGPVRLLAMAPYPVIGYEMPFIDGAVPLTRFYSSKWKRQNGVTRERIVRIFLDLYDTLCELHHCGMLIGDLKPHNILVKDNKAFIVDSESSQFGSFVCHSFSEGYVDPQICNPAEEVELQVKEYSRKSDWYAFTVMFFQCLTNVLPYAGTYVPPAGKPTVPQGQRSLRRISVFNELVTVPDFCEPIVKLPESLQLFFWNVFERGLRARPGRKMLEQLLGGEVPHFHPLQHTAWSRFRLTNAEFTVGYAAPLQGFELPKGRMLTTCEYNGKVSILVQDGTSLRRDDGTTVLEGVENGVFDSYHLGPTATLVGSKFNPKKQSALSGSFYVIRPGAQPSRVQEVDLSPTRAANIGLIDNIATWIAHGKLRRIDMDASIAEFQDRASLFCGATFGLILTVAQMELADVFLLSGKTLRRVISLPPVMGKLRRVQTVFSPRAAWLFLSAEWRGEMVRYVQVLHEDGRLLGVGAAIEGDEGWFAGSALRAAYESVDGGRNRFRLSTLHAGKLTTVDCGEDLKLNILRVEPWLAQGRPEALFYVRNELCVAINCR